jgi:hypothetical protein
VVKRRGEERRGKERKGKERKGKERKGKERKGGKRRGRRGEEAGEERRGEKRSIMYLCTYYLCISYHCAYCPNLPLPLPLSILLACSNCSLISRQILDFIRFQFANRKKQRNALMLHHLKRFLSHSLLDTLIHVHIHVRTYCRHG